ncbi:hypothetical protein IVB22_21500 [Bradyrhizobium sp. 190]|uniref:DUF6894 family protein n=1 Tax=Bradyrhizobium sp. 190 TaxID=2782658 RepID=UPI001FFA67BD|nr:hypothetical protein [Bradyrhizobium sp. 190]MCK1515092.1 hypothetical protein [Bradyrhizobium sp. 190]
MKRYYFDVRDGSQFIHDDEGVELPNIESARQEATTALSEMAREWVRGGPQHRMAVEVRDDHGPILEASLGFVMKDETARDVKAIDWDRNAILDAD